MDNKIRNISELEKALQSLDTSSNVTDTKNKSSVLFTNPRESTSRNEDISNSITNVPTLINSDSKSRLASVNYGTNSLLHNLCGHQNSTNNKLDILIDNSIRTQRLLEVIIENQTKQTEILSIIARNTSNNILSSQNNSSTFEQTTSIKGSVKDYGFMNSQAIVTELLIKLIREVEIKLNAKDLRYRSTRILEHNVISKAVKVACDNEFKDNLEIRQPIKMPSNTDKSAIYMASRIGSKAGLNPILNATTLKEIFNDSNCRVFVSIIRDIIERIRVIAIIIPFYEADIIRAISYPYFDNEEQLICDWNKIQKRSETPDEALVAQAKVTDKEKIATLIARGLSSRLAIKSVIKQTKK